MTAFRSPVLVVFVLAFVLGCPPNPPTDDGGVDAPVDAGETDAGTPIADSLDALPERAAAAICGALFRCCSEDNVEGYFAPLQGNERLEDLTAAIPPRTETECLGVLPDVLSRVPFGDWMEQSRAGRVTFRENQVDACIAELDNATCGAEARAALFDSTCFGLQAPAGGDQQRRIFQRDGEVGAACAPIRDGVGATFYGTCDPSVAFCCYQDANNPDLGCTYPFNADGEPREGTCEATSPVGGSCTSIVPLQFCATGDVCDDNGVCIFEPNAALAVGEPCVEAFILLGECVDGYCDLFGSGLCEALRPNGDACLGPEECLNGACVDGACGNNTYCAPDLTPLDAGPADDDAGSRDGGSSDAGRVDAGAIDGGAVDAGAAGGDAGNPDGGDLSAERCEFAPDLSAVSASSPPGSTFPNVLTGVFGETNDYNPYRDADPQLPPACSTVYDAAGAEVVYALTLAPGETLDVEYQVEPFDRPPALYLLDDCGASPTWPDFDLSGACGNNEYAAIPFCVAGCGPLTQSFTYPEVIGGQTTTAKTFFLVLDTLDQTGTSFELRWGLR